MTSTTTPTTTDNDTAAPEATTTVQVSGTLEHIDPTTLEIDVNVRTEASLTPAFLDSIAAHGVRQPVSAIRRADGTVAVRDGQRRTLAARQTGQVSIPVYITDHATDDDQAREADRIVEQFDLNENRERLTGRDRLAAMTQLLDLGLSPTKVGKRLHVDRKQVAAAPTVAGSTIAASAVDTGTLDLIQAATVAEFEDDPNAVERLVTAAGNSQFDHVVANLRSEQESKARRAEAAAPYIEKGYQVLDRWSPDYATFRGLVDADGETVDPETMDPANVAILLDERARYVDTETREPVDRDTIDWYTEEDPDLEPEDGLRHYDTVEEESEWIVSAWYCIDPAAAGLRSRYGSTTGTPTSTDPEEAARLQAEADEQARIERRRVVRLNKLGVAAEGVRREWVTALLTRKTAPKGAARFVAERLATDPDLLMRNKATTTARTLLGYDAGATIPLDGVSDNRAQVIVLGLVLGAYEAGTEKDAWRSQGRGTAAYLHFLRDNGYTLAEVEEVAARDRDADDISPDTDD